MRLRQCLTIVSLSTYLISCGSTEEDQKNEMIEKRNNSADAQTCKSDKFFWDATLEKCHDDTRKASFSCDETTIKSKIADTSANEFEELITDGNEPLECGIRGYGESVYLKVSFQKKKEEGVLFSLATFAANIPADKETLKNDPNAQKLSERLVGTWQSCQTITSITSKQVIINFLENGNFEQQSIGFEGETCDEDLKVEQSTIKGTWLALPEGQTTVSDPSSLEVTLEDDSAVMYHFFGFEDDSLKIYGDALGKHKATSTIMKKLYSLEKSETFTRIE